MRKTIKQIHFANFRLKFLLNAIPLNTVKARSHPIQTFNQLFIYRKSFKIGSMIKQFE